MSASSRTSLVEPRGQENSLPEVDEVQHAEENPRQPSARVREQPRLTPLEDPPLPPPVSPIQPQHAAAAPQHTNNNPHLQQRTSDPHLQHRTSNMSTNKVEDYDNQGNRQGYDQGNSQGYDQGERSQPPPQQRRQETGYRNDEPESEGPGCCGCCLTVFSYILIILFFPIAICMTLKIVQEYERAIIFRLGRVMPEPKGPGLFFVVPCTDHLVKIDLRTISFDIPPQEVLTKDSVTVAVDGVVYYRVSNPMMSVVNVENYQNSTRLLAQTTLRNMLGMKTLSEILTDRDSIASMMQATLDEGTDPWGIKVERVEIKDVRLPQQLQRAMAAEAEAHREARAKVVAAEGEQKASRALKEAADVINESPAALQLRYLQTLTSISAEKNSTIIFPIPIDMLKGLAKGK